MHPSDVSDVDVRTFKFATAGAGVVTPPSHSGSTPVQPDSVPSTLDIPE